MLEKQKGKPRNEIIHETMIKQHNLILWIVLQSVMDRI